MKLPNFLLVGTAKAGTTSVYRYLEQHPEVFVPRKIKESFFFVRDAPLGGEVGPNYGRGRIRYWQDYLGLFRDVDAVHKAIGEVCVGYLFFHEFAISEIRRRIGDPRIMVILREPVQRAFSNYLHHVRDGYEPESFERALELEGERASQGYWWGYRLRAASLYSEQVQAYLSAFQKVKVFFYEDFASDPLGFMQQVYRFLGVDSTFRPDVSQRYNQSKVSRWGLQRRILNSPLAKKMGKAMVPQPLRGQVRRIVSCASWKRPAIALDKEFALRESFAADLRDLEGLLGRDLSAWRVDQRR